MSGILLPLALGQPVHAAANATNVQPSPVSDTRLTLSVTSTATYSQFAKDGEKFCYKQGRSMSGRGINVAVIHPVTGQKIDCRNFDTWIDHANFPRLLAYIRDNIPDGFIVLTAISDEGGFINNRSGNCARPWGDPRVEDGYWVLESLGSTLIRRVGFWGTWAMISIKGKGAVQESYHNPSLRRDANGYCQLNGRIPTTQIAAAITLTVS